MKKKKYLPFTLALCCIVLVFAGCGSYSSSDTEILSAPDESSPVTVSYIELHSRWYDSDGAKLSNATISFYEGKNLLYEGKTDSDGNLDECTLPGNTELTCTVTNISGETIAESDIIYEVSDNHSSLAVFTMDEESDVQTIGVPTEKTQISAAIFITSDGLISHANLTVYDPDAKTENVETKDAKDDTSTDETLEDDNTGENTDETADDVPESDTSDESGENTDDEEEN